MWSSDSTKKKACYARSFMASDNGFWHLHGNQISIIYKIELTFLKKSEWKQHFKLIIYVASATGEKMKKVIVCVAGLFLMSPASYAHGKHHQRPGVSVSVSWSWVSGYWQGARWISGYWRHPVHGVSYRSHRIGPPPREHYHDARWIPGHWEVRRGKRVWISGRWVR